MNKLPTDEEFEDLLKEAKKRYPVGTKFITASGTGQTYEVQGNNFTFWLSEKYDEREAIQERSSFGLVWVKGNWAEIVSLPKKEYQNLLDIEVGDIVKCNPSWKSKFSPAQACGWKKDLEFKVERIDDYPTYKVYFGEDTGGGVYSDNITLVKKNNSNMDFKVKDWVIGDWIYTIAPGGNDSSHKEFKKYYEGIGELIQIDHFSRSSYEDYNVAVSKEGHVLYIEQYPQYFRKATKEEVESKMRESEKSEYYEYKVGDWVKLTSKRPDTWNNDGEMDYLLGKVVQLTNISSTGHIEFAGVGLWAVSINDIVRLATYYEIEELPSNTTFKVGDKVIYEGEPAIVVAEYDEKEDNLIVEYIYGWSGKSRDGSLRESILKDEKYYHYVKPEELEKVEEYKYSIQLTKSLFPVEEMEVVLNKEDVLRIDTSEVEIKRTPVKLTSNLF
jgi:hypothetical protein